MSLRSLLRNRPVIYEIVPPRRDTSRFNTELRGVEEVLHESRIAAINIPELINRRAAGGLSVYSPAAIPPEEYATMVREHKEGIVDIIAPRLKREEFLRRARKVLHEYKIPNLVLVGRERHEDVLPGPNVLEALTLLSAEKISQVALGGICIFDRESSTSDEYGSRISKLSEARRAWLKAEAGCDFVTSQITFDPKPAVEFLSSYQRLCEETGMMALTVFVSLTTVPSRSILSLIEGLDVVIPAQVRKRLLGCNDMARESLAVSTQVFEEILMGAKNGGVEVPIGLQIEQIGVNNDGLSLDLLDRTYPILKSS